MPIIATAQSPSPAPAPTASGGIVELHDVVFGKGGEHDLHAEIAYPKDVTGPLPAVIYVHGGGWSAGTQHDGPVAALARSGYFAASIEYRLSNVAKWPAQIQDCKCAVRWLRANAAKYNVDPNRIGVWGASAGGHLVACLGTMGDVKEFEGDGGYPGVSSAVQAVVDFFGPTNFTEAPPGPGVVFDLFGVPREKNPGLWRSGSPLAFVKAGDPPTLIVHGDSDRIVPLYASIAFDAAMTKAHVPHQFIIVKNADHGFTPVPGKTINPDENGITAAVYSFLDKYLKH